MTGSAAGCCAVADPKEKLNVGVPNVLALVDVGCAELAAPKFPKLNDGFGAVAAAAMGL